MDIYQFLTGTVKRKMKLQREAKRNSELIYRSHIMINEIDDLNKFVSQEFNLFKLKKYLLKKILNEKNTTKLLLFKWVLNSLDLKPDDKLNFFNVKNLQN